jgi:hypothetical protein
MLARFAVAAVISMLPVLALGQQPVPLYPGGEPRSIVPEPLPPLPESPPPPAATASAPAPVAAPPAAPPPAAAVQPEGPTRVFCEQPVTYHIADPDTVPERYRRFLGIWSDASWTPQLCAALIVENVTQDGTATITYVVGPMGPNARTPGGVLHGTGVIRDGQLLFQNSDGSQFAFRPLYADLDGRLLTPQGQSYTAVFKRTL